MYKLWYLLLIAMMANTPNYSQEIEADKAMIKGDSLLELDEFERANEYFKIAEKIFIEEERFEEYFEIGLVKGIYYQKLYQYQAAVPIFIEFIKTANEKEIEYSKALAMIYHKLGVSHYVNDDYTNALNAYSKSYLIRKKLYDSSDPIFLNSHFNIAAVYEFLGKYDESIEQFKKALEISTINKDHKKKAKSLKKLADLYRKTGDDSKAINYYSLSIEEYSKLPDGLKDLANSYIGKGHSLSNKNEYENAKNEYLKAFQIFKRESTISFLKGQSDVLNDIGTIYLNQGDYQKGIDFFQQSLEINLKIENREFWVIPKNYANIGFSYVSLGEVTKGLYYLQKALNVSEENYGEFHPNNTLYYTNIGDAYLDAKNFQKASEFFHLSLLNLLPDFREKDFKTNPEIDRKSITGSKVYLAHSLNFKAKSLRLLAKERSNDLKLYKLAHETALLAVEVIDLMRQDHTDEGSKLFWTTETLHLYENAILISKDLFKLTGDRKYLKEAFNFSEKSKSIVLLEALKDSDAKAFAGIPDSLLIQEKNLKEELADLEESFFYEKQLGEAVDSSELSNLQRAIFEKTMVYNDLTDQLERDHPDYHRMKYDMSTVTVEEVQEWLKEDQAMLSYFVGDSAIYAFKVLKDDLQLVEMSNNFPLENLISDMRESMFSYFLSDGASDSLYDAGSKIYANTAHQLFQHLLAPVGDLPKNLIIVPAGILGYLPFEALLEEEVANPTAFHSHPYFIKNHTISYSYSATLLREMLALKRQAKYQKLLAFAPSFKDGATRGSNFTALRNELSALLYNINEVENIQDIFGGKIYTSEDATIENFLQQAPQYSILHCATHGKADDQNPDYSFLAFTQKDSLDFKLFVQNLYNLELSADMVTLSACETGIGKLYRGEGIVSLARGFSYAGARSIITTLWSVNDKKMAEIMESFYANLKEGMSKDIALHQSKMTYLENNEDYYCHPFFWAATIPIGNMSAVEVSSDTNWWLLALLAIAAAFLVPRALARTRSREL